MTDEPRSYLHRILGAKRAELAASRKDRAGVLSGRALEEALARMLPTRDFEAALREGTRPRVIAEFKRSSPSAGPIREDADVATIVRAYQNAGAAAISVVTDRHFGGRLEDITAAREATTLPILRKDFVLERSQILEARQAGADAVLLIVAALPAPTLKQLLDFCRKIEVAALVEAHDAHEIDRALSAGASIVGVNNRDLTTFAVDIGLSVELRLRVPSSFTFVAESGIESPEHVARLRSAGVDAVLIGTTLMAADDPGAAMRALLDEPA
jgi:indole-3-glycerol phosphate synthase